MHPWILLALTIVSEVVGTIHLRLSDGFSKPVPSVIVVLCYGLAFWGLSVVMRRIEIGITYAVWSGVGTVLTAALGIVLFKESIGWIKALGIALIVMGVVLLNLASRFR